MKTICENQERNNGWIDYEDCDRLGEYVMKNERLIQQKNRPQAGAATTAGAMMAALVWQIGETQTGDWATSLGMLFGAKAGAMNGPETKAAGAAAQAAAYGAAKNDEANIFKFGLELNVK